MVVKVLTEQNDRIVLQLERLERRITDEEDI